MSKYSLRKELNIYQINNADELSYKQKMLDLLDSEVKCFSRDSLHAHFTASAFIVNVEHTKILLMHHKKLNKWLQPGGHADGNQNLIEVAIKEVLEETGIEIPSNYYPIFDIDIHSIPERKGILAHYHYDVRFLFEISDETPILKNDESNDLKWVKIKDLSKFTKEESMIRMQNKLL